MEPLTVAPAEAGLKLFQFLTRRLGKDLPRPLAMRWIRGGEVRVDGARAKPFQRLDAGQQVRIPPKGHALLAEAAPSAPAPDDLLPLDIVCRTPEIIVLHKPAGLPTQPGSGHADSLATRLAAHFSGADFTPAPAHRLDKATSGLVAAGLTYQAQRALSDAFAHGRARKLYLAWVHGAWPHDHAVTLCDTLGKTTRTHREVVTTDADAGKPAAARVLGLRIESSRSLLAIRLLTGRTHQIRVQFASRGHAVIGDTKYGPPGQRRHTPMLLHAFHLDVAGITCQAAPAWPPPWEVPWSVGEIDVQGLAEL